MAKDLQVYVCTEGTDNDGRPTHRTGWPAKYHLSRDCPALQSREARATRFTPTVQALPRQQAEALGWTPCARCHM